MRRIRSGKSVAAGDAAVFIDSACCCCYFGGASAGGAAQLSDLVTVIPEAAMSHSLTVGSLLGYVGSLSRGASSCPPTALLDPTTTYKVDNAVL